MSRHPSHYALLAFLPLAIAAGCGDDDTIPLGPTNGTTALQCGAGTVAVDGFCVLAGGAGGVAGASGAGGAVDPGMFCGPGTKVSGNLCVPDGVANAGGGGAGGGVNPCAPGENGNGNGNGSGNEGGGDEGPEPFGGGGSSGTPTPKPPVSECKCDSAKEDCDGDGWTVAQGDCCDQIGPCGQRPELQNPGAVEYKGDGVDNDCDGFFDETEKPCDYDLKSSPKDANDFVKALDLCQFTKENVPIEQRKWGVISATFTTADGSGFPDAQQRSIRPRFGENIYPLRGGALAVISTGVAADVDDTATNPPAWPVKGDLTNISTDFGNTGEFPADWLGANGGKLPTGCDESGFESSQANDSIMLTLRVRVPTNAQSFSFQALFMSAEFPEFICQDFNDLFLALIRNEYGQPKSPNPVDGNIAFFQTGSGTSIKKFPVGINLAGDTTAQKLFSVCDPKKVACSTAPVALECALGDASLKGTGYETENQDFLGEKCAIGGGTDWLTVAGNVVPGGILELRILVADVGDSAYDSTVLIDSFTWNATPGTPGTN